MTFKIPGKHTARIIKLSCSTSHGIGPRTFYTDVEFDTIDGDSGHGVTLNASNHQITLSANRHYLGFGFFAVNRGLTADENFQIVATDTSNNYLDADDGFFAQSLGWGDYGESITMTDGTTRLPSSYNLQSASNMMFKIVKSVGASDYTFKVRGTAYISSAGSVITIDGTQLILLEME